MLVYAEDHNLNAPKPGDAGHDIVLTEDVWIWGKTHHTIDTGIRVRLPEHTVGFIEARSSSAKRGIVVLGGVIDESYTGPLKVVLYNTSWVPRRWRRGQRITQLVIVPVVTPGITFVASPEMLGETERSGKGFGERTGA